MSLSSYLEFAVNAAWAAGQSTLAHFQTGVGVERKADRSPVTIADRGAERLLRDLIAARYPEHVVLGEEYGHDDRRSSHRWVLDPIDGTQSFIRGVPLYGVLVGLENRGRAASWGVPLPGARRDLRRWVGPRLLVERAPRQGVVHADPGGGGRRLLRLPDAERAPR